MNSKIFTRVGLGLGSTSLLLISGCSTIVASAQNPPAAPAATTPVIGPDIDAGVPVTQGDVVKLHEQLKVTKATPPRPDPFALLPEEEAYDKKQLAENLRANYGGTWPLLYEHVDTTPPPPVVEPQPYRRLAGIIQGESVTAVIDMGDGRMITIHPGQRIEGTEWMVQSITSDYAILKRVGSRTLPQEVIVRLESPPAGGQPPPLAPTGPQLTLPPGYNVPPGVRLPPGTRLPPGMRLPRDR